MHLLTIIARLLGPGGAQAVVADSFLMKQQLLIVNRSRKRAPNLTATDRILLGFWSLFLGPRLYGANIGTYTFKPVPRHYSSVSRIRCLDLSANLEEVPSGGA